MPDFAAIFNYYSNLEWVKENGKIKSHLLVRISRLNSLFLTTPSNYLPINRQRIKINLQNLTIKTVGNYIFLTNANT